MPTARSTLTTLHVTMVHLGTLLLLLSTLIDVLSVDIGLSDICGNKLVGTCTNKISLKVVGGESSCAQKVPWNVLIELTSGPQQTISGEGHLPM